MTQKYLAESLMGEFSARLNFKSGKTIEFEGPADITKEETEAIVNAANSSLLGGGGVDGAIHRAGGPSILQECRRIVAKIGSLPPGKAVITTGGRMAAKYVVHTVGPVYRGGRHHEAETLARCYQSIAVADDHGVRSLAFPSISTGVYSYPLEKAAAVAVGAVVQCLPSSVHLELIRFVLFDIRTRDAYIDAAEKLPQRPSISVIFEKGHS
jgi:O-acetyl-ADP-ribose deacetylase (regulator of RNase III)